MSVIDSRVNKCLVMKCLYADLTAVIAAFLSLTLLHNRLFASLPLRNYDSLCKNNNNVVICIAITMAKP